MSIIWPQFSDHFYFIVFIHAFMRVHCCSFHVINCNWEIHLNFYQPIIIIIKIKHKIYYFNFISSWLTSSLTTAIMAQWYHRNSLKNTAQHNFTLSMVSAHPAAIQICTILAKSRKRILDLVSDPSGSDEILNIELNTYISLLQGFMLCHNLDKNHASTQSSKLRHITSFKWSNSVTGKHILLQQ